MDEEHRAILRKNFPYLVRDLEPLKLLHDLAEVLDEDDRDEVKSGSSRKNQAETILELLPRKGPKAFECFVGALNKRQKHLARPLIEQSGIDVSNFIKGERYSLLSSFQLTRLNIVDWYVHMYSTIIVESVLVPVRQPKYPIGEIFWILSAVSFQRGRLLMLRSLLQFRLVLRKICQAIYLVIGASNSSFLPTECPCNFV